MMKPKVASTNFEIKWQRIRISTEDEEIEYVAQEHYYTQQNCPSYVTKWGSFLFSSRQEVRAQTNIIPTDSVVEYIWKPWDLSKWGIKQWLLKNVNVNFSWGNLKLGSNCFWIFHPRPTMPDWGKHSCQKITVIETSFHKSAGDLELKV